MKPRKHRRFLKRLVKILEIDSPSLLEELGESFDKQFAHTVKMLRELRAKAMVTAGSVTYAGTIQVWASGSVRFGKSKTMDVYEAASELTAMSVAMQAIFDRRQLVVSTAVRRSLKK